MRLGTACTALLLGAACCGCGGAGSRTSTRPAGAPEAARAPAPTAPAAAGMIPATPATEASDPQPRHIRSAPAAVRVARTRYGRALVDRRGFALYLFTHDHDGPSACYGACAERWPPYIVRARPSTAGRGALARLLGARRRADGRLQVTYRGHPLYYYIGDRLPGQIFCQAASEFGGLWYVVAPNGSAIT